MTDTIGGRRSARQVAIFVFGVAIGIVIAVTPDAAKSTVARYL